MSISELLKEDDEEGRFLNIDIKKTNNNKE